MNVRPAAVAGTFYPADPALLAATVDALLAEARVGHGPERAPPKALILPHAGYVYSGPTAARGYVSVRARAEEIERVVVIGPAHRVDVAGVAAAGVDGFATPLGTVPVDVAALEAVPSVASSPLAHAREHCLEVHLPFLQRMFPGAKVIPLVTRGPASEVARVLEALWGGAETLVVISSDLSHYLPYAAARAIDEDTAQRIEALDPRGLDPERACGAAAIDGLLEVARARGLRIERLDLRSSGDTAGRRDEVVGYGAFGFHEPGSDAGGRA